eukprot:7515299-Pyramimonas_sp.AAC.2
MEQKRETKCPPYVSQEDSELTPYVLALLALFFSSFASYYYGKTTGQATVVKVRRLPIEKTTVNTLLTTHSSGLTTTG